VSRSLALLLATVAAAPGAAVSPATAELLDSFHDDGVAEFSAERGRETWYRDADGRSCTSCHTDSLASQGRHQKTGKLIEPMAPSVNPERLTDRRKISKWFLRNCKWTFGRECTAQEKGDILVWLSTQ
jgi:hypothetical protein